MNIWEILNVWLATPVILVERNIDTLCLVINPWGTALLVHKWKESKTRSHHLTRLDPLPDRLLDLSDPLPDPDFALELARDEALEPEAFDLEDARDALDDARDERLLPREEARELALEPWKLRWMINFYVSGFRTSYLSASISWI